MKALACIVFVLNDLKMTMQITSIFMESVQRFGDAVNAGCLRCLHRCFLWYGWVIVWDRGNNHGRGWLRVVPATATHTLTCPSLSFYCHGTTNQLSFNTRESKHTQPAPSSLFFSSSRPHHLSFTKYTKGLCTPSFFRHPLHLSIYPHG